MTRITSTATINFQNAITADGLMDFAASVPAEARIIIKEYRGDQRDPGYVTLTATWDGATTKTQAR